MAGRRSWKVCANDTATSSPELADLSIYVIDVSGEETNPRKGDPGITRSDLLVINRTDLAITRRSLEVMAREPPHLTRALIP